MLVIDNHVHLGDPHEHVSEYVLHQLRKNWDSRAFAYSTEESPQGEARAGGDLVSLMDEAGITACCVMAATWQRVLPLEERPHDIPNELVAETVAGNPRRFIGLASADPIVDGWLAAKEIERWVRDHGFRGVKLYPTYAHFDPRDERCYPLYEAAIALDVPVHFHMGWTPVRDAVMEFQRPMLLDDVGRRFPKLKVVVCHMGWPYWEEAIGVVARHENFHADVSLLAFWHPEKIYRIIHDFGCLNSFDKLLYGSENPFMRTYPKVIATINDHVPAGYPKIPDDAIEQILGGNALRLYKLDPAEIGPVS